MSDVLRFEEYAVAWVTILPIEVETALGMLDKQHTGHFPSVGAGDDYVYIGGEINGHNVVVVTWANGTGTKYAESSRALIDHVKGRFPNIYFALLVGVAASLPNPNSSMELCDIRLGDVLVYGPEEPGTDAIQYEVSKDTEDIILFKRRLVDASKIIRASRIIRSAISNIILMNESPFRKESHFLQYLFKFQHTTKDDKFFRKDQPENQVFNNLTGYDTFLVQREPRNESERTRVWYNNDYMMMKTFQQRDELLDKNNPISREIETSGIMNILSTCIIRGICGHDGRENEDWQPYAAAVAAAYAKEILYTISPGSFKLLITSYWYVPFKRNKDFIGRKNEIQHLLSNLDPENEDNCKRVAISGLGGIGKTQIALEAVFRIKEKNSDCSVFWVSAIDKESFESAYREIGQKLEIRGINDRKADIKSLVKEFLSQEKFGRWLMVVDSAENLKMLFDKSDENDESSFALVDYLPFSSKGSVLFITQNYNIAFKHTSNSIIKVNEMSRDESYELLETSLDNKSLIRDKEAVRRLLDLLANLPFAIKQTANFFNQSQLNSNLTDYLDYFNSNDKVLMDLLSRDYLKDGKPVPLPWWISFQQIQQANRFATEYLYFMSCLAQQSIPLSLLSAPRLEQVKAFRMLRDYAFITSSGYGLYDIHPLVQLAVRNWLKKEDTLSLWKFKTFERVAKIFHPPTYGRIKECKALLPHVQHVLEFRELLEDFGESSKDLLFDVGDYLSKTGNNLEAEKIYRKALDLAEKVLSTEHPLTHGFANNLASVLRKQGRYKEAETMHRKTLESWDKSLGAKNPLTLTSANNLALVLQSQGQYKDAEAILRRTLQLREKILGAEHPDTITTRKTFNLVLCNKANFEKENAPQTESDMLDWRVIELEVIKGKEELNKLQKYVKEVDGGFTVTWSCRCDKRFSAQLKGITREEAEEVFRAMDWDVNNNGPKQKLSWNWVQKLARFPWPRKLRLLFSKTPETSTDLQETLSRPIQNALQGAVEAESETGDLSCAGSANTPSAESTAQLSYADCGISSGLNQKERQRAKLRKRKQPNNLSSINLYQYICVCIGRPKSWELNHAEILVLQPEMGITDIVIFRALQNLIKPISGIRKCDIEFKEFRALSKKKIVVYEDRLPHEPLEENRTVARTTILGNSTDSVLRNSSSNFEGIPNDTEIRQSEATITGTWREECRPEEWYFNDKRLASKRDLEVFKKIVLHPEFLKHIILDQDFSSPLCFKLPDPSICPLSEGLPRRLRNQLECSDEEYMGRPGWGLTVTAKWNWLDYLKWMIPILLVAWMTEGFICWRMKCTLPLGLTIGMAIWTVFTSAITIVGLFKWPE